MSDEVRPLTDAGMERAQRVADEHDRMPVILAHVCDSGSCAQCAENQRAYHEGRNAVPVGAYARRQEALMRPATLGDIERLEAKLDALAAALKARGSL